MAISSTYSIPYVFCFIFTNGTRKKKPARPVHFNATFPSAYVGNDMTPLTPVNVIRRRALWIKVDTFHSGLAGTHRTRH